MFYTTVFVVVDFYLLSHSKDHSLLTSIFYLSTVRLGTIPDLPAESCKEIKASEGEYAVNGKYWFHFLEIEKILLAYCDMKTGGK
jgi:hypothetical protein